MTVVRLCEWRPGLNKVAFTKLIREAGGAPLNEAHDVVNRLLEGERPELRVASQQDALRLVQEATALGVRAECVVESDSPTAAS